MATSPRWLPLLVLGLLVGLPGSLASIGAEIFSDSRNGGGIGRRRLREGRPPANETASSSMAARAALQAVEGAVDDPEMVASMVQICKDSDRYNQSEFIFGRAIRNSTARRALGYLSCGTGNPIDDCWRCDPDWHLNRKRLADCGIGFGRNAIGGRDGLLYEVTDPGDDDPVNPRPGTLRHAVIQDEPLWIVFKRDMVITLKEELIMNSFKTIDGRGANVHIANGACITIQFITNVIIHGLHIHDCKPTGNAMVRSSPSHYGWRTMADGDGVSIFGSSHVWVDHCSLSNCADGLVDAVMGSTAITISNNHLTHHNEVMLLGHSDSYERDKDMQVTIAFNHFGEGLIQRMPRCRHGYFHVVNNDYTHWEMYAIGGSASPTINSQGNRYLAPANPFAKEVTKRLDASSGVWKSWNWRSEGDLLLNGAYFTPSGAGASASYSRASSLGAKPSSMVGTITSGAGALSCRKAARC
ncbi:Pectate lyase [Cocos nucifera]|uniref:Pectate lyase n=1 Tax=Cocos nucifera TaxID=13894 RepID=A0A8K0IL51_COCNU|nr:Pectate lyase [Cocos nucifera]